MKTEPEASPQLDLKIQKVLGYRVSVKIIARLLLKVATSGVLSEDDVSRLEEIARGR